MKNRNNWTLTLEKPFDKRYSYSMNLEKDEQCNDAEGLDITEIRQDVTTFFEKHPRLKIKVICEYEDKKQD